MSSADNLVPHIIIINNVKSKVAVTTKLTPVEHRKHRCSYISFEYLLPCKRFIFATIEIKYFLKPRLILVNHQKILNPEEKTIYRRLCLPLSIFWDVLLYGIHGKMNNIATMSGRNKYF